MLDPATPDKNLAPIVTVGTPIDTSGVERIAEPVLGINRDAEDAVTTESPVAVIDTDASALIDQLYPQGYYGPIVTHHPTKSGEIKFKYAGGGGRVPILSLEPRSAALSSPLSPLLLSCSLDLRSDSAVERPSSSSEASSSSGESLRAPPRRGRSWAPTVAGCKRSTDTWTRRDTAS